MNDRYFDHVTAFDNGLESFKPFFYLSLSFEFVFFYRQSKAIMYFMICQGLDLTKAIDTSLGGGGGDNSHFN